MIKRSIEFVLLRIRSLVKYEKNKSIKRGRGKVRV